MVYGFTNILHNFNNYCQDKSAKWRQPFSPASRSSSTTPNSTPLEHSPSSSMSSTNAVNCVALPLSASNQPQQQILKKSIENDDSKPVIDTPTQTQNEKFPANFDECVKKIQSDLKTLSCNETSFNDNNINNNDNKNGNCTIGNLPPSIPFHQRQRLSLPNGREVKSPIGGMTSTEFRRRGRQTIDYMADYMENVHNRRVVPSIEPGYLRELIPPSPPQAAEDFERVLQDFENYIMPGVTHWQHPRFHAYFPAGNSYPSILADMLSDAIGCVGFSWAACPAMTELEMIMLQWFGQMIGLPKEFLPFTANSRGGGVIQGSASECNFVALLAARFEVMKELRQRFPFVEEGLLMSKLIAYCSKESHSSVEKAAMIGMVKLRILETDAGFRLRGPTLQTAITEDRNLGLIPFFVSTTLGTTSVCSFDVLAEVGPVCTENDLWLHVDAAYAGSAMVCPEFRYLMSGVEHAMSFNTNPNKWMLVNFDCSTMWVKDRFKLTQALVVDPLYLQHSWTDKAIDYRHWGIPLSRRFRALKLWFVIRMYGVEGIQRYILSHVRLAKKFESLLLADEQFEIIGDVLMGLVCFRLKASDELNQSLLTKLNSSGLIHMVPASLSDRFVIRFCVCAENATDRDIVTAYEIIKKMAHNEPVTEPIAENYELEKIEEKQYENIQSQSVDSSHSRKSLNEGNISMDSTPPLPVASGGSLAGGEMTPFSASNSSLAQPQPSTTATPPIDRRRIHSLAEKRSFLVRMVSDPKCYNPKIVRHLNMLNHKQTSQDLFRDRAMRAAIEFGSARRFGNLSTGRYQMSIDQPSDDDELGMGQIAADQTGIQAPL